MFAEQNIWILGHAYDLLKICPTWICIAQSSKVTFWKSNLTSSAIYILLASYFISCIYTIDKLLSVTNQKVTFSKICILLPPFQIVVCLTFLILSLIAHLIQKICANIAKFKSFLNWRSCIDKATHNKRRDIFHKFLNNTSGQTWGKKIKRPII